MPIGDPRDGLSLVITNVGNEGRIFLSHPHDIFFVFFLSGRLRQVSLYLFVGVYFASADMGVLPNPFR